MGGHDKLPKVPSPDIYKVEDVPKLVKVQERLAKLGLKDPWLRNEVWRYEATKNTTEAGRLFRVITTGWRLAIPAFLLTIAIEKVIGVDYENRGHDWVSPYPKGAGH